jgi:hypothetical protein
VAGYLLDLLPRCPALQLEGRPPPNVTLQKFDEEARDVLEGLQVCLATGEYSISAAAMLLCGLSAPRSTNYWCRETVHTVYGWCLWVLETGIC